MRKKTNRNDEMNEIFEELYRNFRAACAGE